MQTKIILLLALASYSIIVSQSYMYLVALKNVQNNLTAPSYIELRKLLDTNFRAKYKYAVIGALITNLLLVILTINSHSSLLMVTSVIAFVALVADLLLTVKGNLPINKLINGWSADNYPADWDLYRTKWLLIFSYRQVATITGFFILLIGTVFGLANLADAV